MSADRSMSMSEPDLEAALRDLGATLALPAGPAALDAAGTTATAAAADLAARVRARIVAEEPRRAGVPWWRALGGRPLAGSGARPLRRSLLLAAAALLIAAAAVTAAIGFGLPGIRILFGGTPQPVASATGSVPSSAPGALLGLGTPVELQEAEGLVGFDVVVPPEPIGPPDAVYVQGPRVALVWGPGEELPGTADPRIGLVLIELRATVDVDYIDKLIFSGTSVETIDVDGAPGYWISGDRHDIGYVGPDGTVIQDSIRVAGNTLLWTSDGITYRLEGELTRAEAIALASSLR